MARIIKSPDVYVPQPNDGPTVFLAGGITGCNNWQAEAEQLLKDTDYTIFNPRRNGKTDLDPDWAREQIRWEHKLLKQADFIMFWFPKEGKCMITLFELGKALGRNQYIAVGADPEYCRHLDVDEQMMLECPQIGLNMTLHDTVHALRSMVELKRKK